MNAELTISLPQSIKNFIDEQVAKGGYSTPDEYVCDLVREAKECEADERIENLLLEALYSGEPIEVTPEYWEKKRVDLRIEALLLEALDSGLTTPMTKEDWEEIRQRGLARIQEQS